MMKHLVYSAIVRAVKSSQLKEPFGKQEFKSSCLGFKEGTYLNFLNKHRKGNPGSNSELFELISKRRFRLLRPFKYGL